MGFDALRSVYAAVSQGDFTWADVRREKSKERGEDSEGEALKLRALLEEVAMKAVSKEQEYALHHRIEEMLDEGHLLETIEDKILGDLRTELRKTRAFLAEED